MKLSKTSYQYFLLCGLICRAINFKQLGSVTPVRRMALSLSSNPSPPVPLRKVDYNVNQDHGSRHFNHRGDWGRIAELSDAIYSDPKNISNWNERARLYKESDLPFNAYSDLNLMGIWSSEKPIDWKHFELCSSVMCAIGDPMRAMKTLALGLIEFKELAPITPNFMISILEAFLDIDIKNFEDLSEFSWIELEALNTLERSVFDEVPFEKIERVEDFKSWIVALMTTSRALVELRADLASMEGKAVKIVSSRKELNSEFTGNLQKMKLSERRSRLRTEFRYGPGGDRSPEYVLSVLESPDTQRPLIINKIRVQPHPRGGFGIFATEDIPANDVVLVEYPLFSFNDDRSGRALCHHCHRTIATVCACERCQEVYCSSQCRQYAASTYHAPLCGTKYKAFEDIVMKSSKTSLGRAWCVMAKMIGAAAMMPRKSPGRPNTPLDIPSLAVLSRRTDVHELSESMLTEFKESISNVMSVSPTMFSHLGAIAFENPALDLVSIQTLFNIMRANSFLVGSGDEDSCLAHGIFLWGSFFNHACEPNTFYLDTSMMGEMFSPAGKAFCTDKAIAAGEELSISYAELFHLNPSEKRSILMETYGFECQCNLCKSEGL